MKKDRPYWYLEIDRKHCDLPVAVSDSIRELAEICHVNPASISKSILLHPNTGRFIRVLKHETDDKNYCDYDSTHIAARPKYLCK